MSRLLCRAREIGFAYPGHALFAGLSFDLGSGLTLLRLIAGEIAPTGGRIERDAAPVYFELPADAAHDDVLVRDWLAARQQRFGGWRADIAADLIEGFGLAEHIDKPMYMLSTGSRRKAGLVAAAASQAALTLVDMPYAALDAPSSRLLSRLLADAAAQTTRAWVIADHERPAALAGLRLSVIDLGD